MVLHTKRFNIPKIYMIQSIDELFINQLLSKPH